MNTAVLFSSKTDQHATPQDFFDTLNEEFNFTLDACANKKNAKCTMYYSKRQNGLKRSWSWAPNRVWMNPPYGRQIGLWVRKAYEESQQGCIVVCLLPSRTDTKWFQDYCMPYGECRFVRGRLKFGAAKNSAPFPSVVVIFRPLV